LEFKKGRMIIWKGWDGSVRERERERENHYCFLGSEIVGSWKWELGSSKDKRSVKGDVEIWLWF
jgi:hypothetical protein